MRKSSSRLLISLLIIIAIIGFMSCEKIIDISIPDQKRKIVVNGLISSEKPVQINLSRSLSVLEKDTLMPIKGGVVNLFHDSNLVGRLIEGSDGNYRLPDFLPQVGQSYKLTASFDDLDPVEALAVLPPVVPIVSVDTATLVGEWGQSELRVSVKFVDPPDRHNIYGFGVDVTYKEFDYQINGYTGRKLSHPVYLYGGSDQFTKEEAHNFGGQLYFEDLLFNGMTKVFEFGVSDYAFFESDTVWLDVKLEQIDPSYFLYAISNEAYQSANGNPFSEPVQVYSNIKRGYGIFAGSTVSRITILVRGNRKY
jgi:hypothetical protein